MTPDDDFIRIGVVTGLHGLNGRLKIQIISDIAERFSPGNRVYISKGTESSLHTIIGLTIRKEKQGLLKLEGIDSAEEAAGYRGADLLIPASEARAFKSNLEEEEYFYSDIIGCDVFLHNEVFGVVADIMRAGSGEILVVAAKNGKQYMIPFVTSMVDMSRISEKRIVIHPVEGLFDI